MNEFTRKYYEELKLQEINANRRTIMGFFWFISAMTIIWVLTMSGFFLVSKYALTVSYVVSVIAFIPVLVILRSGNLSKTWYKYMFLFIICVLCAVITAFLSFHAVLLYVLPLIFALQYRRESILWFTYGVNAIGMLISMLVGFFYGLCDLNLLFVSQHERDYYLSLIDRSQFIGLNENPIFIIIVFGVFPRCIILLIFTIMMQYTIKNGNVEAYRIAQLSYQKETDTMTKVYNKNKYEEMTNLYYPRISSVAAVYWDINDFKSINDVYGHDFGDTVIEFFSSKLNGYSNYRIKVYRVGGDEFLIVIEEPADNEAEDIVARVNDELSTSTVNDTISISCAHGIAYGTGTEIKKIVKEADAKMYMNKKSSKR